MNKINTNKNEIVKHLINSTIIIYDLSPILLILILFTIGNLYLTLLLGLVLLMGFLFKSKTIQIRDF